MAADSETVEIETENRIDPAVFDAVEPLADTWVSGQGKRFYNLMGADASGHGPVYALTSYERVIDDETGDTIERETLDDIGILTVNPRTQPFEQRIYERLHEDNPVLWDEPAVEHILHEFEAYLSDRFHHLLNDSTSDVLDLHLLKEIRIPISVQREIDCIQPATSGDFSEGEWDALFWALEQETTVVSDVRDHDDTDLTRAYSITPEFESVPDWRLRAIENLHCGIYKHMPALAHVSALLDSDSHRTQAAIAEELDKNESTISQQVADVKDRRERAHWTSANRA